MSDEKSEKVVHLDKIRGYWFHDPTIPQEEVDTFNAVLALAAQEDPRWGQADMAPQEEENQMTDSNPRTQPAKEERSVWVTKRT